MYPPLHHQHGVKKQLKKGESAILMMSKSTFFLVARNFPAKIDAFYTLAPFNFLHSIISHSLQINMDRIVNRNPKLFGPGPLARRPSGLGAKPPLQGLVMVAAQGIGIAVAGGFCYSYFFGYPRLRMIEQYYRDHPPR